VTVVVPAYNVERYLGACLDSVLGQTAWPRCRVMVVDDGSTDGTSAVARRYEDGDRVRVVHQPNGGPGAGAARNHGLDLVDTEYVIFLDGDDELTPHAIELLARSLDDSGLDLAVGATEQFPEERTWPWSTYFAPGRVERVRIEQLPQLVHDARTCNKLYRTAPLVASGLRFAEGIHHQDTVVNVPAMLRNPEFMLIGDVVHRYRKRAEGGSVMDSHFTRIENFWDHLQVIETLAAMSPDIAESRRPLLATFIARSFQGFAWRAPQSLPQDRLREFFDRTSAVVRTLPVEAIEAGTRNALERAAYVAMLANDFASFASLDELTGRLEAHDGDLYLAVPCADRDLRELLRAGSTRAWIDQPTVVDQSLRLRTRLRIRGTKRLDTALERVVLHLLHSDGSKLRQRLVLTPTEDPAVFTAEVALPLSSLRPGSYRFRLWFHTPTGHAERWMRRPPPTDEVADQAESVRGRWRRITLETSGDVAELQVSDHPLLAARRRLLDGRPGGQSRL